MDARAIIEAHGERIWADSSAGTGAKICFGSLGISVIKTF